MDYLVKCHKGLAQILLFAAAIIVGAQSPANDGATQKTPGREYWTDPDTGLMWAGRDSGKDMSWKAAVKYCRDLRLAGYSGWRLADMFELQGIYDRTAEAPGLAGRHSEEPTTWHVKGNLFLTAYEWSDSYRKDDRGHFSGLCITSISMKANRLMIRPDGLTPSALGVRSVCVVPAIR
jgi:hypothetical protein